MKKISRRAVIAASAAALSHMRISAAKASVPLRIGALYPFSGIQAAIGASCRRALELSHEVLHGRGYPPFEILYGDTESKVDTARSQAERLIDQGIDMLTGCFVSPQTLAAAQVCEARGKPIVVSIAAVAKLTELGYKTVFRIFPTDTRTTKDSLLIQKELFSSTGDTPKKAVLLHLSDTLGTSRRDAVLALSRELAMPYELADTVPYDGKSLDLSAEVRKAKSTGAQLVLAVSRVNDATLLCQEMVKQRWSPTGIISLSAGWYESAFMRSLGKYADDVVSTVAWFDPKKPLSMALQETFKKFHPGLPLDTEHTYVFESVLVALDAYKRARSAEPGKLIEALRGTNLTDDVITGAGVRFDEKGQNVHGGASAIQNRAGKSVVIFPKAAANGEPIWPMRPWDKRS